MKARQREKARGVRQRGRYSHSSSVSHSSLVPQREKEGERKREVDGFEGTKGGKKKC